MNKYIISYTIIGKTGIRDTKEFSTSATGAIAKVRRYWKKAGRAIKVFGVTECGVQP
jgi:hypothetical protein